MGNVPHKWWVLVSMMVALALLVNLVFTPIASRAGAPPAVEPQQEQWAFSLEGSENWDVKPDSADSILTGFGPGCWGAYANAYGEGGVPKADGTRNKWTQIDEAGNMTGGCNIKEGDNSDGRSIKGTLTGKFTPVSNAISNFHIETSETITNNINGKIDWSTTTLVVDGSGGALNPPDSPHTHQVSGKFTITWKGSNYDTDQETGSVTLKLSFWKFDLPYRIQFEPLGLDQPTTINLLEYRIILEERDSSGNYKPMAGETISITVPSPAGFANYYEATECTNCTTKEVLGKTYAYEDFSGKYCVPECLPLQNVGLRTNERGEAFLTLYLAFGRLAKDNLTPTKDKPLVKTIRALYPQGKGADQKILAKGETTTDLRSVGIVEGVYYTWASYRGENPQDQGSTRKIINLDELKETPERARVIGASPGRLLYVGDKISVDACDLPPTYGPQDYGGLPKPAAIAIRLRYFDGTRMLAVINSGVCKDEITIGNAPRDNVGATLGAFFYWASGEVLDLVIETVLTAFAGPAGAAYNAFDTITDDIPTVVSLVNDRTVYVQLHSQAYLQNIPEGGYRVTTLEGQPVIFTDAPGVPGVPVPVGQTATIPPSMIPAFQPADTETMQSAELFLKQLNAGEGEVVDQPAGMSTTRWLIVGGAAGCGLIGFLVVVVGVVVWAGRRKPKVARPAGIPVRQVYSTPVSPPPPAARPPASYPPPDAAPAQPRYAPPQDVRPRPAPVVVPRTPIPSSARLVVAQGVASQKIVNLTPAGVVIGRDQGCGLMLQDPRASRRHAMVEFGNGVWFISDLDSANGTCVNNQRIRRQALRPGDCIQIGDTEIVFQAG